MTNAITLVGLTEIAQRAGVQKPTVSGWRTTYEDFPDPAADLVAGPVWFWPEVADWLTATGRRTDADWTVEQVNAYRNPKVDQARLDAWNNPKGQGR